MVKINAICRDKNDYKRSTNTEIEKVFRNSNPNLHPFMKAREYQRALNAVKLEKVFAKPFIGSLNNHTDGVKCMAKNTKNLSEIVSGGFDGQIILWDLPKRQPIFNINSGHSFVKGVCFSNTGDEFISAGDDQTINIWNKHSLFAQKEKQRKNITISNFNLDLENPMYYSYKPTQVLNVEGFVDGIDHSYSERLFATAGTVVAVWNYEKNTPVNTFKNSVDGFLKCKFNPVENHILLATGYDRSINLYDLRTNNPLKNVVLNNKSAAVCWNPQEPFNFTVGNEDSNCYTFDMRKLEKIKMIHKDHILAVLDIDYSPTGKEFVTGSYDKTLRIFKVTEGNSRECYHTQRMQKIYSTLFTMDDKYVLSGSDDTNIRLWKSVSNDPIKILNKREEDARNYNNKIIQKYQYNPEIKRIKRHQHVPKYILNRKSVLHIKRQSKYTKLKNKEMNSKLGSLEYQPEKIDKIVKSETIQK